MGEVVPAHTSLTLHPPFPPTACASIVATSTVRVKIIAVIFAAVSHCWSCLVLSSTILYIMYMQSSQRKFYAEKIDL